MQTTEAHTTLVSFRSELYARALGLRKDTLFELMEAALVSSTPATLVHLSLEPVFRRGWASACDALSDGSIYTDECRRLAVVHLPPSARPVWALDGTTWPRPAAHTSPERTWGHMVTPGVPQSGILPSWEYQWLVQIPLSEGSWVLPLDVARRAPTAGTPTQLGIAQLRQALKLRQRGSARPVVTADSSYDPIELAQASQHPDPAQRLECDLLVRLSPRRRFYRQPPPYSGRGAPRKHGEVLRLCDESTHGQPDRGATTEDAAHGQVKVDVWEGLHAQWAATTPITLVRVEVERLPRSARTPKPLWLVWIGHRLPEDLLELWRLYKLRFGIEHWFRFLKSVLGWTSVRPNSPQAADRWSWLMAMGMWQLWLARSLVADRKLPWERRIPVERLSPGRVRRAFVAVLACVGTPSRAVTARGKSPGRRRGQCPGPRTRYEVVRRRPKRAA